MLGEGRDEGLVGPDRCRRAAVVRHRGCGELGVEHKLLLLLGRAAGRRRRRGRGGWRVPCLVPRCAGKTPTQHACDTEINGCRRPLT